MSAVKAPKRLRFPIGNSTDCAIKKPIAPKAVVSTILVTRMALMLHKDVAGCCRSKNGRSTTSRGQYCQPVVGNSTLIAHRLTSAWTSFTCQRTIPRSVKMLAEHNSNVAFADVCGACRSGAIYGCCNNATARSLTCLTWTWTSHRSSRCLVKQARYHAARPSLTTGAIPAV